MSKDARGGLGPPIGLLMLGVADTDALRGEPIDGNAPPLPVLLSRGGVLPACDRFELALRPRPLKKPGLMALAGLCDAELVL